MNESGNESGLISEFWKWKILGAGILNMNMQFSLQGKNTYMVQDYSDKYKTLFSSEFDQWKMYWSI